MLQLGDGDRDVPALRRRVSAAPRPAVRVAQNHPRSGELVLKPRTQQASQKCFKSSTHNKTTEPLRRREHERSSTRKTLCRIVENEQHEMSSDKMRSSQLEGCWLFRRNVKRKLNFLQDKDFVVPWSHIFCSKITKKIEIVLETKKKLKKFNPKPQNVYDITAS